MAGEGWQADMVGVKVWLSDGRQLVRRAVQRVCPPNSVPSRLRYRLILLTALLVLGLILVGLGRSMAPARMASGGPVAAPTVTRTVTATVTHTAKPALPASCAQFVTYALKLYDLLGNYTSSYGSLKDQINLANAGINGNRQDILNQAQHELTVLDKSTTDNLNNIISLYQEAIDSDSTCKGDLK